MSILIKCACGCEETLEYDGITKTSQFIEGHDKREKPPEVKTTKRNISKVLTELKAWKFSSERRVKKRITRSDKKKIREKFDHKCVVCGTSQEEQINLALKNGKRPSSLVIHTIKISTKNISVPLCSTCFKLNRTNAELLHEQIISSVGEI